jgi:hypothetical protein
MTPQLEALEVRRLLAGDGLSAKYFDNIDLTNLKLTRTDANVNFNWQSGAPASGMGVDTFSVQWTGQVQANYSQSYKFYTSSDDGVRLWVNGNLVINKWQNQAQTEYASAGISLVAGQRHDIKLEYFENTGLAAAKLSWSSASQVKQVIPQASLFSTSQLPPSPPSPVSPPPPPPPPPPPSPASSSPGIRIDAGSKSSFTDSLGNTWSADYAYTGGNLATDTFDVVGTTDDALYCARRYAKSFTYSIPAPIGQYAMTLLFTDTYAPNQRKFDVTAEGQLVLDDFDISASGGVKSPVRKTFTINIADNKLDLQFTGVIGNATISGIELIPLGPLGPMPPGLPGGWVNKFNENFDSISSDIWTNGKTWWNGNTVGDSMDVFDPSAVSVTDGVLQITAQPQATPTDAAHPYTSGFLSTGGIKDIAPSSFSFQYGYVEARIKAAPGQGMWSAFWMLPASYVDANGELDVSEILGRAPTVNTMTYHVGAAQTGRDLDTGIDLTKDFHTYGVDWEPDHIAWYIDGVEKFRTTSSIVAEPMYLIVNLFAGGEWAEAPDATTPFPATMQVDFVRVWQKS